MKQWTFLRRGLATVAALGALAWFASAPRPLDAGD